MIAYNNDPELKAHLLSQMRAHRELERLIQGQYWDDGRGCAVGCLTHDPHGGHEQYEQWGIPETLAHLEDVIFEWLPVEAAQGWPERFLSAIPVGADLSMVWPRWIHETLQELLILHPVQADSATNAAVRGVRDLYARVIDGETGSLEEWRAAAEAAAADAARAAAAAAEVAAWAARWAAREAAEWAAADTAACRAAARAAWEAAAWVEWASTGVRADATAAEAARAAANAAARAARAAAGEVAEEAARVAAWARFADRIIRLLEETQ